MNDRYQIGDGDTWPAWRLIEPGPTKELPWNGEEVLIGWFYFRGQKRMHVAMWNSISKCWCTQHTKFSTDPNNQPTHFVPLPPSAKPIEDDI